MTAFRPRLSSAALAALCAASAVCSGTGTLPRPAAAGRALRVLALPGGYDALECLPLGEALGPLHIDAGTPGTLARPGTLAAYDIVLVSCGSIWEKPPEPLAAQALAEYVRSGGRVMVTDRAYPLLEAAWPDLIDFAGPGARAAEPQPAGGAFLGPEGDVAAEVTDAALARHLGATRFQVKEQQIDWAVMRQASPDARVFVRARLGGRDRPLAVAADFPGGGRVVYASFHGHAREAEPQGCTPPSGDDAERALVYLLAYALAPARATAEPRPAPARPPREVPEVMPGQVPVIIEDSDMQVTPAPPPGPRR